MKNLLMTLLIVLIAGCGQTVQVVRVPVPILPPKIELPQKPNLLAKEFSESTPLDVFIKGVQLDYVSLIKYSSELEEIVKAYQGLPEAYFQSFQKEIEVENKGFSFFK